MPSTSVQLWVVATPLGNLGDFSPRAKEILQSVDLVLAEDTRKSGLLCQRAGIKVQGFSSLHEHNEQSKCASIIKLLQEGKTAALISDAGTPLMADPGFRLVKACREAGLQVSAVPGPCAPVNALMLSGIAPQPFTFLGFLPRTVSAQEKTLSPFANLSTTLVFFERKDRLHETLKLAHNLLGPRELAIARELTKTHEECIVSRLEDFTNIPTDLKGEITVVIGPPEGEAKTPKQEVLDILKLELAKGGKPRDVARRAQNLVMGWTSKDVYLLLTEE